MIINGLENLKEIFEEIFLSKDYPCKDCIIISVGCDEICNKVEMDSGILADHFNKRMSLCPDCGGKVSQSEDGKDHGDDCYRQCENCKHFFVFGFLVINIHEPCLIQTKRICSVERWGH